MTINEGDRINLANFAEVPTNSTVRYDGTNYTVHEGGLLYYGYNNWYVLGQLAGGRMTMVTAGYSEPISEGIEGFRQRIATICVGFARANSVATGPVTSRLHTLEAPTENDVPLGVGMWVHRYDRGLFDRVARKRGVRFGLGNPNDDTYKEWDQHGSFLVGNTNTGRPSLPLIMRVVAMDNPDTEQWLNQTPADPVRLARYKGRIWTSAVEAKADHSYCGQLEAAMYACGISAENVAVSAETTTEPGQHAYLDVLNAHQMNALPVGAVLQYTPGHTEHPEGDWNWVRRSNSGRAMRYPVHTLNLCGPNGGSYSRQMRLIWDGRGDMLIPLDNEQVRAGLPVGTEVAMGLGMLHFRKVADDAWQSVNNGQPSGTIHSDSGFPINGHWFIVSLPEV